MKTVSCLLSSAVAAGVFLAGAFIIAPSTVTAQEARPTSPISMPTNIWAISRGGQLYDKWWAVIEADAPKTTHPAYPAAGKKKGSTTWRCKECHGWDYKGRDGKTHAEKGMYGEITIL